MCFRRLRGVGQEKAFALLRADDDNAYVTISLLGGICRCPLPLSSFYCPNLPGENLERNDQPTTTFVVSFPSGVSSWKLLVWLPLLTVYCVEILGAGLAIVVLLVFALGGCFAAEVAIIGWMPCHRLLVRADV